MIITLNFWNLSMKSFSLGHGCTFKIQTPMKPRQKKHCSFQANLSYIVRPVSEIGKIDPKWYPAKERGVQKVQGHPELQSKILSHVKFVELPISPSFKNWKSK